MPSEFDILAANIIAPSLMEVHAETKGVIFRGLGENKGDLVIDAIVGQVTTNREIVDEGRRETRRHVEEVEIRLVPIEVPLNTAVQVPSLGSTEWTVERVQNNQSLMSVWMYRSEASQIQRANLERGVRNQ